MAAQGAELGCLLALLLLTLLCGLLPARLRGATAAHGGCGGGGRAAGGGADAEPGPGPDAGPCAVRQSRAGRG